MEGAGETPAIVFESGDLQVREEFSFIRTAGSESFNGIRLTIRVRNRREGALSAGLCFLLDTSLGEESGGKAPLFINNQGIPAETLVVGSVESLWISRGASLSLMGSIGHGAASASGTGPEGKSPDYLQFADWQRLSEASRKTQSRSGRNFDYPPYSFNDAALSYYYVPALLPRYGELYCTILLAAEDPAGFAFSKTATTREDDLALLRNLISRMDYYLEGQIEISEEELVEMEESIARLKARYNIP